MVLPQLAGRPVVTDGGLETDLIFHHGVDLPEFASFPLLDDDAGRALLEDYFLEYVAIAAQAGAAVQLETPTWRANPDWGAKVGYSADDLRRVNAAAIEFLQELRRRDLVEEFVISGNLGPRGDGYVADGPVDPDAAAAYHLPQLAAFADAGADIATALTLTGVGEAIGIVRAARRCALPVAVSFTVETDGTLPDGSSLHDAIVAVDAAAAPDYFMVNCAHPHHIAPGLATPGEWRSRIVGLRVNASQMTHEELDNAEDLDEGNPSQLARDQDALRDALPALRVIGGCCGTDARHVAAMWGVEADAAR